MLSHGVVSAALFLIVGVVYDRIHSREISDYGGLVYRMTAYSLVFMLFMLASIGLPGTGGFVGEFLVLVGLFKVSPWLAAFAATGIILSAAYMLYLYRRIIFGQMNKEALMKIKDLSTREWTVFAPLIVLTLWMGIYPSSFLDFMHVSVENLINQVETALASNSQPLLVGQ
jgi:NADH-quinone oxidoreductase subunit M